MTKQVHSVMALLAAIIVAGGAVQNAAAQGYGAPLTMQGLNHSSLSSAAARATGGITVGIDNDPSVMFENPASLARLERIQFTLIGTEQFRNAQQTQEWLPLRNFPTFSLMMEGLIDSVNDPDLETFPPADGVLGPIDSIPRPYDQIKPNWTRSQQRALPLQACVAVPLAVAGMRIVGGAGIVQYANLDYYFRNSNVLSPSLGTQRPYGVPLPGIGQEVAVRWSQYVQSREGSINGYGGAVSILVTDELSFGISGLLLRGESDDMEATLGRGRLRFGNDNNLYYFVLDSVDWRETKTGTSTFKSSEYTFSSLYKGEYITLSLAVKAPNTFFRTLTTEVQKDTAGSSTTTPLTYRDRMKLPWRGTAGLSLAVHEGLTLALEYEIRPYASAEYMDAHRVVSHPWLSGSAFRAGAQYTPAPWLTIRAGFRTEAEVFQEEGNALVGEPLRYTTYSAGFGFGMGRAHFDFSYEYSQMKYQDLWQTNINLNSATRQLVMASVSYSL